MKTVGIPRALLYHKYGNQWKSFFEGLGFKVLISDKTNRKILTDAGDGRILP